jgi:Reverse transcriptase (RNA-dependent DNA polymerase)
METWCADVGNAYLEAKTSERVYIIAGPEFGDLKDHILIIHKALYGLRTSGKMWSQRFADCLRDMGFTSSKAEPDIWMRRCGDLWEYIATYVDDLCISSPNPKAIIDVLTDKYQFKLKGVGPISFHLGCDYWREDDGTLCYGAKKYADKMMSGYERMFGQSPSSNNITSPLEKGDHPELDTSELLDEEGIQMYQSLVGSMQWAVSIGRFDINVAVMTLSSFRTAPRRGHLERAKRVYSYLCRMRHAVIRIRTQEPDYSDLPSQEYDWTYTPYGNVKEQVPHDMPEPLGNYVTLTHFFDANLYHDLLTGRSVTGILHLLNQTPIDWFAKKQNTVETATYGSEFVAARTCIEQVMDLRTTLRYLGVPIRDKSYIFGDNKSMIDSATIPHSKLHKRHTALSWHRVREAMAAGIAVIYHVHSESNPADILSKHWGYSQVWDMLKPLLFWKGDTMDIVDPPTDTSD